MKQFFRRSIRRKLAVIVFATSGFALMTAAIAFVAYGVHRQREAMKRDIAVLADVIGSNSTASLIFGDSKAASEALSALAARHGITLACTYTRQGVVFGTYVRGPRGGNATCPTVGVNSFSYTRLKLFRPILLEQELIGTVYIESDLEELDALFGDYLWTSLYVLAGSLLTAFLISGRLQGLILRPILQLSATTRLVREEQNFSVRAVKSNEDEIGALVEDFNQMLQQIQERDGELQTYRDHLEEEVAGRTSQLQSVNRELTTEKERAEAVSRAIEKTQNVLNETQRIGHVGSWEYDLKTGALFWSDEQFRIVGFGPQEFVPTFERFLERVHPDDRAAVEQFAEQANCAACIEFRVMPSPSEIRIVRVTTDVDQAADGKVVRLLGVTQDVTQQIQMETALRASEEHYRLASRAKSDFLAKMSHEIRTPMNGIIGMTELALETSMTTEQREYMDMVRSSAESLLGIINDILDFSKIEAGKLELDTTEFDLRQRLTDITRPLALRSNQKGVALLWEVAPDVPNFLSGDPSRLQQVLINLISNAIKFTKEGNVQVRVAVASRAGDGIALQFSIADTGMGIPADKQDRIFEAFNQADSTIARKFGGTGLGLAIASQIVKLMGGKIWLESTVGVGSTFYFTVNLHCAMDLNALMSAHGEETEAVHPAAPARPAPGPAGTFRVLVAEDNPVNQLLAVRMLERMGHTVELVENGKQAARVATERAFDLVMMDIEMPEMTGVEATSAIREFEKTSGKHVPIIAMTAYAMKGDRERFIESGMDGYISKPVRAADARSEIERVMAYCTNKPVLENPPLIDASGVDQSQLIERAQGDVSLLRDMIRAFATSSAKLVSEIHYSVAEFNPTALQSSAHTLKGSAAIFGPSALLEIARTLETCGRDRDLPAARQAEEQLDAAFQQLNANLALVEKALPFTAQPV